MEKIIIDLMNQFGYLGVAFLIMVENIFPPIPSELILTFGGFMTTKSELTVIGVILFATFGSLLGAIVLYYIGSFFGLERMQVIAKKTEKVMRVKPTDVLKAKTWFDQKGNKAVLLCRFVPIVRSLISLPAGMAKMNMKLFVLYTLIGSLIWNSVLVYLGRLFGANYEVIVSIMNQFSHYVLIGLIVLFIGVFVWWFFIRNRKAQH